MAFVQTNMPQTLVIIDGAAVRASIPSLSVFFCSRGSCLSRLVAIVTWTDAAC